MSIFKRISIADKSLGYKLAIAFSLMTVIPLLACVNILHPYLLLGLKMAVNADLVLFIALCISLLGLVVAKSITDAVVNLAGETRKIAGGEYERRIVVSGGDEVGNLGQSINDMTQKIKSNLDELKGYGQSMKQINVEIHKKVLALSSLLHIGDIIFAGGSQMDSVLNLAAEKASSLFDTGYSALYLPREGKGDLIVRASYNIDKEKLDGLVIKMGGNGVLEKALEKRAVLRIDKSTKMTKELEEFMGAHNVKNVLAIPLFSEKAPLGLFLIGNRLADFKFAADDIDLVSVFAKHITIAIESDLLSRKNEELVIRDDLTGLFNKRYIANRLEEEIKRSIFYQRPCSFIVLNVDSFGRFREAWGELAAEEAIKRIAKIVRDNTSPVGKVARVSGDEFAILLPEKNKREAAFMAEDIRKKIAAANFLKEGSANLTVSVGVSENPIDGATSDELLKRAGDAVKEAKAAGRNRVVS